MSTTTLPPSSVSASNAIRLRTWAVEIAVALLPEGTDRRIDGADIRFSKTGGLCINKKNGAWYVHSVNKGGWGTVGLIKHLRQCSTEDAFRWSSAWLAAHPGTGSCDGGNPEEEEAGASALASAEYAQQLLSAAVPVEGTVGEVYLRARALLPPYPERVKFVPDVRTGEHGLLGILTARGRIVGVQLGYLGPTGAKTLVLPVRRVFLIDRDAGREGVFDMKVPVVAVHSQQTTSDRIFVEGLENALSLWTAKAVPQIQGIPGIGRLEHMKVRPDERIVVFRDGDPPGSAADKAALAGMDNLLLQGATVSVTATPAGEDANSLHLRQDGLASLLELITQATLAELSLHGEVIRLSRLDAPEYDQERMSIVKKLRIRVATLDDLVKVARSKLATTAAANEEEEPPWEGEVVLRDVLDAALAEIRRHVIAPDVHLGTIVVWSALTHITHNEHVRLQKSPRLAILSRVPGSGKTTCLDIVCSLSLRGTMASSFTASSVLRGMDADKPTLLLDEVDGVVWSTNSELGSILKAGDRRRSAIVKRSVPTPDGGWEVRDFCVWGPVAFAAINELPQPIQERSLCIWLERALGGDTLEHLQDGTSPRLVELRRQLKAWGDQLMDLPDPDLPEVLRRQPARLSDNWRPIMALARLAGGQWPALITEAIEAAVVEEQRPNMVMRLLRSILRAFNAQAEKDAATIKLAKASPEAKKSYNDRADNALRLTTPTLLRCLLTEEDEEWATVNRGRAITPYYLRHQLRHLLKPKGAMDWWTGPAGNQKHHSGYTRQQFKVAWVTILPGEVGEDEVISSPNAFSHGSGVSGVSGADGENPRSGTPDTPEEDRPEKDSSGVENRRNQRAAPDAPDTPDDQERVSGDGHAAGHEPTRANGASARPDVASNTQPTAQKSRSTAVQAVRDLRVEHPDWSPAKLARSLGVAEAKVLRALRGWEPPPLPSADSAEAP